MIVLNVDIIFILESDRDCKPLDNIKFIIIRASSINIKYNRNNLTWKNNRKLICLTIYSIIENYIYSI